MEQEAASRGRTRTVKGAAQRRAEILAAALELFDDRGLEQTTMSELAEAAGVATGTVYLYFASKEHLLEALHADFHAGMAARFAETFTRIRERVAAGLDEDYGWAVEEIVGALADYTLEHRKACAVFVRYLPRLEEQPAEAPAVVAALAEAIELGRDPGVVHASDPEIAAELLYTALRDVLADAVVRGDEARIQRVIAQAKELYRKALAPRGEH